MRYAEIAVDAPTGRSQTFSYHIPDGMSLAPGQLVRVPFGVRALQGIVFEVGAAPQVEETRPVSRALSDAPVLSSHQISLARWISDYYICSLFEAAAPMLPPGSRTGSRTVLSLNPEFVDCRAASLSEGSRFRGNEGEGREDDSEEREGGDGGCEGGGGNDGLGALSELQAQIVGMARERESVDVERVVSRFGERARSAVSGLVRRKVLRRRSESNRAAIGPRYVDHIRVNEDALGEIGDWLPGARRRARRQYGLMSRLMGVEGMDSRFRGNDGEGGENDGGGFGNDGEGGGNDGEGRGNDGGGLGDDGEGCGNDGEGCGNDGEGRGNDGDGGENDGGQVVLDSVASVMVAAEARKEFGSGAVRALVDRGWLEIERTQVFRDPLAERVFEVEGRVTLSERQAAVAADVAETLRDAGRGPRAILVQGVTGSGKTEVYLRAVEECLALGRQAVVMVPEISLTPQTIERFAGRFAGKVAVLHSGLSDGQRYDQWWAIKEGRYPIVVGSRSAVFAPVPNPGLVILDEEHEWTYKQNDAAPRYHARDVAMRLGGLTGAVTLMGSASPDVASYYRGLRGEYRLHTLPDRLNRRRDGAVGVAPLPEVEVVDMREELREGNTGIFSRRLEAEIEDCLRSGRQAILFLNRRGTASQMQCRSCGHRISCGSCDVPLTYHRAMQRLLCHYCGRRRRMPRSCPECLGYRLSFYGIGTQSVAEETERLFPGARVLRWDRDATRYPREYEATLASFRNGDADALIGTQMIAKGLHLPGVTLVGVALADVGLSIPDFKSSERTFQLLCQVAGRAGRGSETGRVIFQTYQPENYAIERAAAQDYEGFYEAETRYRREHNNPPFSRLIRLVHSHTNNATCEARAMRLGEELRSARRDADMANVEILGPTPPYPARLRGRYRWHIVLRGREPRALLDMVSVPQGWAVDVDPVTLT